MFSSTECNDDLSYPTLGDIILSAKEPNPQKMVLLHLPKVSRYMLSYFASIIALVFIVATKMITPYKRNSDISIL